MEFYIHYLLLINWGGFLAAEEMRFGLGRTYTSTTIFLKASTLDNITCYIALGSFQSLKGWVSLV